MTKQGWCVVMVGFAIAGCKPTAAPDQVALRPLKLPGAELSFPEGDVEAHDEQFTGGVITMKKPYYLQLRWNTSDQALTAEQVGEFVKSAPGAGSGAGAAQRNVKVAGLDAQSVDLDMKGQRGRLVTWYCPKDRRQFMLFARSDDGADALTDRVLATARCDLEPASERPHAIFPQFDAPAGFTRKESPSQLGFEHGDEGYFFMPAVQGTKYESVTPEQRKAILHVMEQAMGFSIGESSDDRRVDSAGHARLVITARATSEGKSLDIAMVAWHCKERDLSFLAIHVVPRAAAPADAAAPLLAARCP